MIGWSLLGVLTLSSPVTPRAPLEGGMPVGPTAVPVNPHAPLSSSTSVAPESAAPRAPLSSSTSVEPEPVAAPRLSPEPSSTPPPPRGNPHQGRGEAIGAAVTGAVSLASYAWIMHAGVGSQRCRMGDILPPDAYGYDHGLEEYPESSGWDFEIIDRERCEPYGMGVMSLAFFGSGLATSALSAFAGEGWGRRDDFVPDLRRSRRILWSGVGLRLAGGGLFIASFFLPSTKACPEVLDGRDDEQLDDHMRCYSRRTLASYGIAAASLTMRWAGAGMIGYGARATRRSHLALSPFVQPGRRATILGLEGRF